MDRKRLPLLALVFIGVSASLFGANWKRDHPTPTTFDLEVRQLFVHDEYDSIDMGDEEYRHSSQERKRLANHLFLIPFGGQDDVPTDWYQERIVIDSARMSDFYRADVNDLKNDNIIAIERRLHPATSRFLRQWLSNHSEFKKKF